MSDRESVLELEGAKRLGVDQLVYKPNDWISYQGRVRRRTGRYPAVMGGRAEGGKYFVGGREAPKQELCQMSNRGFQTSNGPSSRCLTSKTRGRSTR